MTAWPGRPMLMEDSLRRSTTLECASLLHHAEMRRHDAKMYPFLFTEDAKADLVKAKEAIEEALMMLNQEVV